MSGHFDPKRRLFLKTSLAAIGGLGLQGLIREALAMAPRPHIDGVQKIMGEVMINGSPASVGMVVKPGDRVTTGTDAHTVLVVGKDAFLVRDRTRVEITAAAGNGTPGKPLIPKGLRIASGKVLSVFEKGVRRVTTPTAVAGVRGTGMYVEAMADMTYCCTCYGSVDLEAVEHPGARETLTTTHHEEPRYILGKCSGSPILKAPMYNHKDDELILLEALVDRIPPFVGSGKYY